DAYERLKRAKRTPRESFSEVVRRLPMPAGAITAGQYLALVRERGALLTEDDASAIDELNLADKPPQIP
ncbi:MAG: antitoxin VapB family protein, partial [Chthoniobacterales bacterium]